MTTTDGQKVGRGTFDLTMRHLAQWFPADIAFLSLGRRPDELEVLSPDLPAGERRADWLAKVTVGAETFVLHVEFQTAFSREKILATLDYWVRVRILYGLPVFSVVIYLTNESHPGAGSNRFQEEILGHRQCVFEFQEIRLWELNAGDFLEAGVEGLLPLLPLMRSAPGEDSLRQVVETATKVPDNVRAADLLAATAVFASLKYPEDVISGLIRREMMKESAIIQGFILEALEEGREEGIQKGALIGKIQTCQRFLRQRLSPLSALQKKSLKELRGLAVSLEKELGERRR
jgi:predicted transposase YdaD